MPKKVQDIITNSKKREPSKYFSELARATKKQLGPTGPEDSFGNVPEQEHVPHTHTYTEKPKSGKSLILVVTIAFIGLVLGISIFISGATITIIPKSATVPIDNQFEAIKNGVDNVLPFELVAISDESKSTVQGSTQSGMPTKAIGKVVLYNNFSATPQKLLINTRLEAPNGKIYMTDKALAIPGYTKTGSKITPGQIEVAVTAEKAGSAYNAGMTDFVIFGFKGTAKAKGFYGRSKTEMTGGSEGAKFGLAADTLKIEQQKLAIDLRTKITDRISKEIPEGYVLFPDSITIVEDPNGGQGTGNSADINLSAKGTGYAYIFDQEKLTNAIAKAALPDMAATDIVAIKNMNSLTFSIPATATTGTQKPANEITELTFKLTGTAKIVWGIDAETLKSKAVGADKRTVLGFLTENPGIVQADVVVRPFWQRKLPKSSEHIDVVVKDPFE